MNSSLKLIRILLPIVVLAASIALWELVVRVNGIQPYVLPAPSAAFRTLLSDWPKPVPLRRSQPYELCCISVPS